MRLRGLGFSGEGDDTKPGGKTTAVRDASL